MAFLYFDAKSEYEVGGPQVLEIFREANIAFEFTVESVLRKDRLELTDADRQCIRARVLASPCARILSTHGTDTMTQTAPALADIPGKSIVLTGSMQPARFRGSPSTAASSTPPARGSIANASVLKKTPPP